MDFTRNIIRINISLICFVLFLFFLFFFSLFLPFILFLFLLFLSRPNDRSFDRSTYVSLCYVTNLIKFSSARSILLLFLILFLFFFSLTFSFSFLLFDSIWFHFRYRVHVVSSLSRSLISFHVDRSIFSVKLNVL